jgi:GAF domain-containing protein
MSNDESFFKALSKLSRDMAATDDRMKMANLIVSTAVKTLKAKAAAVFLIDDNAEGFIHNKALCQVGLSEKYIHAGPAHAIKIGPQLMEDGYMYFRDATTDKRLANHEKKKAEGIGSILSVPVKEKGRLMGILSVYTKEIRKFTKDEIDFLSILAEQGGAELENVLLIGRLRQQSKIFLKLASSISESLDVKTILQAMTEDLVKPLRLKAAAVQLLDEDKHNLKRVACFGLSEKYLTKGPIVADKNMAEALKGKTIAIHDVLNDLGIQYKKEKKEEGILSMLYVPIKSKNDVIGVLIVYSGRQRKFTEDEVLLLTALAYQGGLAISNACMYMIIQDDIKDLKENIWGHKAWF